MREVGGRAARNVVTGTPVDTAWARSNWVGRIGGQDLTGRPIRSANAVINDIKAAISAVEADQEIHITNGGSKVPYLKYLDDGWSLQAPKNFVRIALMLTRPALAKVQLLALRRGTDGR